MATNLPDMRLLLLRSTRFRQYVYFVVGTAEDSLDLVGNVSRGGATLVNYFYLADGTKTRALDGSGEGLVYRGPFVYRKGSGSSSLTLESAAFGGGRLTPDGALLYMTDYLGSVRAVIDGATGQIYKAVDYSAYGAESDVMAPQQGSTPEHALAAAALPSGMTLRDSFTGQEDQTPDFGTSYTDFGARQYSPAIRRWMTPDPMSEKYYGMSPYVFCADNPVNFVDPDGEAWETFWDLASLGAGVKSLTENIKAGNVGDAILDGIGVVADAAAVLAPGIPGGVGASIAAVRTGGKISDVLNFADGTSDAARTLRKAPDANGGMARPHGNADHDASITEKYNSIKDVANDIRKNQIQVDVHGNVVGNNRPDLQYNVDGIHYNFEVDRSEVNSERHRSAILNNDPYSVFEKRIIK